MFIYPIRGGGFNLYGEFRGLKMVSFKIKVKFYQQNCTIIGENWKKTGTLENLKLRPQGGSEAEGPKIFISLSEGSH